MLTIQFGQCGNQLGYSFFQQISADLDAKNYGVSKKANATYKEQGLDKWFTGLDKNEKRIARAILVDTEHKVIRKITKYSNADFVYKPENIICQSSGGSANNWAYGYLVKGPELKENIIELARKEIESVDHFEGIKLLLSSAGGTGSGVGSYSTEILQDAFPSKTVIGCMVLPFPTGEVGVQNYNTMFTLSKFCEFVDLNLLFMNENVQKICQKELNNKSINLFDMNDVICRKLSAVLQPTDDIWYNASYISSLAVPHPSYKLATIKSIPYISNEASEFECYLNWIPYIRNLKNSLKIPYFDTVKKNSKEKYSCSYAKSVSNILVTRGKVSETDPVNCDELKHKDLYADWVDSSDRFTVISHERRLLNQEKFLALLTNNSDIYKTLDVIIEKAWDTYCNQAFIHHYQKFGLTEDDFLQGFAKCENVIKDYKNLC